MRKQSEVIESARINALARMSERIKTRKFTEYGKDMRRVYHELYRGGIGSFSGDIMCKVSCQGREM